MSGVRYFFWGVWEILFGFVYFLRVEVGGIFFIVMWLGFQ